MGGPQRPVYDEHNTLDVLGRAAPAEALIIGMGTPWVARGEGAQLLTVLFINKSSSCRLHWAWGQ